MGILIHQRLVNHRDELIVENAIVRELLGKGNGDDTFLRINTETRGCGAGPAELPS